jgi:hypothetical protein
MEMVEDDSALKAPLDLPEDTTQHAPPPPSQPMQPKKSRKYIVIIAVVILVALLGFCTWYLLISRPKTDQTYTPQTQVDDKASDTTEVPSATATKTYTNDIMRLNLTHPDTWVVTEENDAIKVESPNFKYTTVDKGTVTGVFRIYIRQGAQAADSKIIGEGVAIMPSEKLVYSNPTPSQRKETNLSFFGLKEPNNFAFFLIAGNFTLNKGDSLGPNYGKEPDTFIIGGGYSSKDLKDGLATVQVPVGGFQETTAYKQAVDILKSIQIK